MPATLNNYKDSVNSYIIRYIGHIKLCELTVANVRSLLQKLEEQGLSSRTIKYAYTLLNALIKQAINDELINKNVVSKVDKPKQKKIKELITLTADEVQRFLNVIENEEHHAFFKLAFTSGMRRSELLGLRWSDIDFDKSIITVNQTVLRIGNDVVISKTTKTASSRRSISIDKETLMELKSHRLNVNKRRLMSTNWINNDLVFPGRNGDPIYPTYMTKMCKKYATAINRPNFSMHGTRHTHATLLIENGVHFKVIQTRLGHSSYAETMDTYSHITPVMEADVIDKIRKIF